MAAPQPSIGALTSAPDPDDRRRNVVSITRAGSKQLQALDAVLANVQVEVLALLAPADRKQFIALLRQLLDD